MPAKPQNAVLLAPFHRFKKNTYSNKRLLEHGKLSPSVMSMQPNNEKVPLVPMSVN